MEKTYCACTQGSYDDLYPKIDQKVARPWPDQPDQPDRLLHAALMGTHCLLFSLVTVIGTGKNICWT